jgi:hypothetical protein
MSFSIRSLLIKNLCLIAALSGTVTVSAQFPRPIRARIFVPPIRGILTENSEWAEIPNTVYVTTTEGQQTLQLSRNGYSRIFRVPPNGEVLVTRTDTRRQQSAPWIRLQLQPGIHEALILVEPGTEDDAGQVQASVLDVSTDQFENTNVAFHNFLENPVRLTISGEEVTLPANGRHLMQIEDSRIRIFLEEIDGSGGRRYTGAVHIRNDAPTLVTIRPNQASGRRLDVNTFTGLADEPEE